LPRVPLKAVLRFKKAYESYLQRRPGKQSTSETAMPATVSWTSDDVRGIANTIGITLSRKEAEAFLKALERPIRDAMVIAGCDVMLNLLRRSRVLNQVRRMTKAEPDLRKTTRG
jgi:hypothetical protein